MASVEQRPVAVSSASAVLFNPRTYDAADFDEATRRALLATIDFFERRGKATLKDARPRAHLVRRLPRVRQARAHLRDAADAGRRRRRRPRQALGHARASARSARSPASTGSPTGTRGRSRSSGSGRSGRATNDGGQAAAPRELLEDGAIFAFGLSEQEHGADIYSTDMVLTPGRRRRLHARTAASTTSATATRPAMVSVFGRRADVEGPDGYVFFAADCAAPGATS